MSRYLSSFFLIFAMALVANMSSPSIANAQKSTGDVKKTAKKENKNKSAKSKTEKKKKTEKTKSAKKSTSKKKLSKKKTSICQDLKKSECGRKSTACSWVDATTRKDGVKVKAYCRKKSKPSTGASKSNKKSANKSEKKTTNKNKTKSDKKKK